MRNVSNAFKEVIKNGGPFYAYAKFLLSDGTELIMTSQDDFYVDGNSYGQSGSGGFPIGDAISKTIDIGIDNHDDRYSKYDFYKAIITLYTEADLPDGTTERLQEGIFTVVDSVTPGEIIEITAYDNMYKSDVNFESELTYPNTLLAMIQEVCKKCDLSLKTTQFKNYNMRIPTAPENVTARQLIGYIAQIAGGNALIDEVGYLVIKEYDLSAINEINIISGGNLTDDVSDYISGGEFGENVEDYISGGEFGETYNAHILSEFTTDPNISTDDITITGVRITLDSSSSGEEERFILYGTDEYVIDIDNPLATGNERIVAKSVGDSIIGITVRPFSGNFLPNPTIEFMDNAFVIDRKDNIYQSIVTSNTFTYLGNSTVSNDTKSPEKNGSTYKSNATDVYRKVQATIKRDRTEWEKAVENLDTQLQNASGLYQTNEVQPDGSTIYYLHDKKTLEESEVVIKITSQAIGISTDGGQTYPTGITVDGEAIIKILQTVGINSDWITTGTLNVGGVDNQDATINILNSDGSSIGTIDNFGISLLQGGSIQCNTENSYVNVLGDRIIFADTSDSEYGSSEFRASSTGLILRVPDYISWTVGKTASSTQILEYTLSGHNNHPENTLSVFVPINAILDSCRMTGDTKIQSGSVTVNNNVDVNIYSNVNMHNYSLENVGFSTIASVNGVKPYTGQIPIVTSISATGDGGVRWTTGYINVSDGLITGGAFT